MRRTRMVDIRWVIGVLTGVMLTALAPVAASAQGLTVVPVNINMTPGQQATVLTIENHDPAEISFQVRAYTWGDRDGEMKLDATDQVLVSPPLGNIAAGASQLVRIVLRKTPQDREATYRILLDQIPPAGAPGIVRVALRLSIPIFAQPQVRTTAHLLWRVERHGADDVLVATNDGNRHETIRDILLATESGAAVKVETRVLPYVLAGSSRRWRIQPTAGALVSGSALHLKALADSGTFEQSVPVANP